MRSCSLVLLAFSLTACGAAAPPDQDAGPAPVETAPVDPAHELELLRIEVQAQGAQIRALQEQVAQLSSRLEAEASVSPGTP